MRRKHLLLTGLVGIAVASTAQADDPFTMTIVITEADGARYAVSDSGSNAEEIFDRFNNDSLRELVHAQHPDQSYDADEVIQGYVNLRGVDVLVEFPNLASTANGNRLVFSPSFTETAYSFDGDGSGRNSSVQEFKDFIKGNEQDLLTRLQQEQAKNSPTDPIAGNPGSAQSMTADRDFDQGFTHKVSQVWGCGTSARNEQIMLAKAGFACQQEVADMNFRRPLIEVAQLDGSATDMPSDSLYEDYFERMQAQRGENQAAIGIQYAQIKASGTQTVTTFNAQTQQVETEQQVLEYSSSAFTLPLSYTVVFDSNPKRKLVFQLPIGMTKIEDATSYNVALGIAYSHPVTENWSLTPSAGYGIVGSEDLAAGAAISSFSLTSSYTLQLGGWAMNIGNMIGSYSTQKLKVGDYESDPQISNTIMTNGILFSGPSSLLANDLVMEYFINDTRFSGDELFTDNAQEVGVNFGKLRSTGEVITSYLKAGVSYLVATGDGDNEVKVVRLSLSFRF